MSSVTFNENDLKKLLHDDYKLISVKIVGREIVIEYEEVYNE